MVRNNAKTKREVINEEDYEEREEGIPVLVDLFFLILVGLSIVLLIFVFSSTMSSSLH